MEETPKRTRLYDWHTKNGANMANFGGYEMPLWYAAGTKAEHLVVLTGAGMFDTSHMAVVKTNDMDAFDLLQLCSTRDLNACAGLKKSPLTPGRCVYGAFLNTKGESIDDAIVYRVENGKFLIVVNAGMGGVIAKHLTGNKGSRNVGITDLTDNLGKLDVQGPLSAKILSKVLANPSAAFDRLDYFSFRGHFDPSEASSNAVKLKNGVPILLSRTGYTGEFGFEIFIQPDHFVSLWENILEAGQEFGLIPCGLAARDSLRAGAVLPLSHQDIGHWFFMNNPWTFTLPYNEDQTGFTKTFIGSDALENAENLEFTHAFIGSDLRKVTGGSPAKVFDTDGNEIGMVLTCVTDMGMGPGEDGKIYSIASPDKPEEFKPKGLSCGFVKVNCPLKTGQTIELRDNRRKIKVTITEDIRPDRTARKPMKDMLQNPT